MSATEDHVEAQIYELGYLVLPSIAEEDVSQVVDTIKGIIKKSHGSEIDSENPIKIDLAYTMSKTIGARKYVVNDAYIGWIKFESDPSTSNEVSEAVKKLDEVLRFILVKTTRETHFTFAEALRAKEEEERAKEEAKQAPVAEADLSAQAGKVIE